jgi:hypothetical protein
MIFTVAGWRLTWRVAARWTPGGSPSGTAETVIRAASVVALRAAVMAARQNVLIDSYRYWSIREWDDTDDPSSCPTCGTRWVPVEVHDQDCTCGGHRRWEHRGRACPPIVLPRMVSAAASCPARLIRWLTRAIGGQFGGNRAAMGAETPSTSAAFRATAPPRPSGPGVATSARWCGQSCP